MNNLELGQALPISEEEIRNYYTVAHRKLQKEKSPKVASTLRTNPVLWRYTYWDYVFWLTAFTDWVTCKTLVHFGLAAVITGWFNFSVILGLCAVAVMSIIGLFIVNSVSLPEGNINPRWHRRTIGPLSLLGWLINRNRLKESKDLLPLPTKADIFDPKVLKVVVDDITSGILEESSELDNKIAEQIQSTEKAIDKLGDMTSKLNKSIRIDNPKEINELYQARINASNEALTKLKTQREILINQADENRQAALPIREMVSKLNGVYEATAEINSIQEVYGIMDNNTSVIANNAATLSALKSLCSTTEETVKRINCTVDSFQKANVEVQALGR